MLNLPNPYVIAAKWILALSLLFGAGYEGYHIRDFRADRDIAAIELKQSKALVAAQADAHAKEQVYLAKIYDLGLQNAKDKQTAATKRTNLVHDLRVGTVQLRDEWNPTCPAYVPSNPNAPVQSDDAAELRREGTGDLIENADNADADLRAWQAYGKAVSEATSGK